MNILFISGSRNKEGQTARALKAICRGAESAGAVTETIFLPLMRIKLCQQCDSDGWGKCRSEGYCILEDDFEGILKKIQAASFVVLATPVYFGDISERMRAFLDRYRRVNFPKLMKGIAGESKPAVCLCYAGGSGNGTGSCMASLERAVQGCGFDVVDLIPLRRQNLEAKIVALEIEGKWLSSKPTSGPPWRPPETEEK